MKPADTTEPPASITTAKGKRLALRWMTPADLEWILVLESQVQSHPWGRATFESRLRQRDLCWVVCHEGTLIGYAVVSCRGGEAELLNITVGEQWQRQGIARCLLQALIGAVTPHADNLFLEVRVSNFSAIALYEALDFLEVGCRRNYYPSAQGREDALLMARIL